MPKKSEKYYLLGLVIFLLFTTILFFYFDWQNSQRKLTFAMLDIGQGDALFIESPTGTQILVDGGPPGRILNKLPRVMSPFDRSIDAIIITNPDTDHIGGFIDVLKSYKVGKVFEPGTFNDSNTYKNLKNTIKEKNVPNVLARRGMRLHLGGGAVLDILFPDRDVSLWTPNDGSVVARLSYGQTSVMLTGDATVDTEKIILSEYPKDFLQSDILKAGHHGSRTSSSPLFVKVVSPSYTMISVGAGNKYGHPHQETLDTLASFGVKVLRTDLLGTIVMKSDGEKETFSFIK